MSLRKPSDALDGHRFFHAMVLMGSSIALGCGGETSQNPADTGAGGANASTAGASGASSTSSGGAGASDSTALGAAGSTGGAQLTVPGNTGGGGGTSTGGSALAAFPCETQKLECPRVSCTGPGFVIANDCKCNPDRPSSALDCAPNEALVCRDGRATEDGQGLPSSAPFECECRVPESDCRLTCAKAYGVTDSTCGSGPNAADLLCGCALVLLR
jgi:hypothetical protein